MTDIQERLLEMFKWLTAYLDSNHLRYYVIGGTMLGAVRHKGFIPWDDDIDIAMPRRDYEVLIKLLEKPVENYYVESPKSTTKDYLCGYSKFYDLRTTLIEDVRKPCIRGIFIDIFPLDGIGNTLDESKRNYKRIDRVNMLLASKVAKIRKQRKWWKNLAIIMAFFIPVSAKKLSVKLDRLCSAIDYDDSCYVGNLMSTYRDREIMERSIFGKPTLYEFEGIQVYGPECYDKYLTTLFNKWNELPPENKRTTAHDFKVIDLGKPFKDYNEK